MDDVIFGEPMIGKRGKSLSVYINPETKWNKDSNSYDETGKVNVSINASDTVDGVTTSRGLNKKTDSYEEAEKLVEEFLKG